MEATDPYSLVLDIDGSSIRADASVLPGMTPHEPWAREEDTHWPWYNAHLEYVKEHLGRPCAPGSRCLVVGSPVFEVNALVDAVWEVLFLDVRQPPPTLRCGWIQGDACFMPIRSEVFDALSSTCVICHAGLGRYGDPEHINGDRMAVAEFARVLKPGGRLVAQVGVVYPLISPEVVTIGVSHRVYSPEAALKLLEQSGFRILHSMLWGAGQWLTNEQAQANTRAMLETMKQGRPGQLVHHYLSVTAEKT